MIDPKNEREQIEAISRAIQNMDDARVPYVADNDNEMPRDYFMPAQSTWRWGWVVLMISLLLALVQALLRL